MKGTKLSLKEDAEEFGIHTKAGGWRLGLLVARNVERGKGEGGSGKAHRGNRPGEKVSARKFAGEAGLSDHKIVLRYLDSWDYYAEQPDYQDIIKPSGEIRPDDEIELDEEELGAFRHHDEESDSSKIKRFLERLREAMEAVEQAARIYDSIRDKEDSSLNVLEDLEGLLMENIDAIFSDQEQEN